MTDIELRIGAQQTRVGELIDAANATTGAEAETLTEAMDSLISTVGRAKKHEIGRITLTTTAVNNYKLSQLLYGVRPPSGNYILSIEQEHPTAPPGAGYTWFRAVTVQLGTVRTAIDYFAAGSVIPERYTGSQPGAWEIRSGHLYAGTDSGSTTYWGGPGTDIVVYSAEIDYAI